MRTALHRPAALWLAPAVAAGLLAACERTTTPRPSPAAATPPPAPSASSAANQARDLALSAEITARLWREPQTSALSIGVATAGGRVVLRGMAHDSAARVRAAEVARGVDGVIGVENELSVQPRP
jgi:BON domain